MFKEKKENMDANNEKFIKEQNKLIIVYLCNNNLEINNKNIDNYIKNNASINRQRKNLLDTLVKGMEWKKSNT